MHPLLTQDPDLAAIRTRYGEPPTWQRDPSFATLLHIILEQQVSLASARRTFEKLNALVPKLTPETFLTLDDAALKSAGFSRQKTRYGRALTENILKGELRLESLPALSDEEVLSELTNILGIGAWTANIYLLMVLRREDIWPRGDLALAIAVQEIKSLSTRPTQDELATLAQSWQPHRSYAARLLWHYYLSR